MRDFGGVVMGGGSSKNLRLVGWMYDYMITQEGTTVQSMVEYLNNYRYVYKESNYKRKKGTHSFGSHQVAGGLNASPLFKKGELVNAKYLNSDSRGKVLSWFAIPVEEVVDKMLSRPYPIKKRQPEPIKKELHKRGIII